MICFQETTDTGFGDRLRGVAHLLNLAARQGEQVLLYNDDETIRTAEERQLHFPAHMTDLIRVEGLSFEHHPLPLPPEGLQVVYDSRIDHRRDTRPGFKQMRRLRPRDPAVEDRVRELGVDRSWLGFHVRETDNLVYHAQHFDGGLEERALKNVASRMRRGDPRRVFLAADNARSLSRWRVILETAGYEVRTSEAAFDPERRRQTSTFDMMVDFFGLASCRRVVRAVPSEFSRFAAWMTGHRMKYSQLC